MILFVNYLYIKLLIFYLNTNFNITLNINLSQEITTECNKIKIKNTYVIEFYSIYQTHLIKIYFLDFDLNNNFKLLFNYKNNSHNFYKKIYIKYYHYYIMINVENIFKKRNS